MVEPFLAASTTCLVELTIPCARFVGSETTHWAYVLRLMQTRHRHSRMILCFIFRFVDNVFERTARPKTGISVLSDGPEPVVRFALPLQN